MITHCCEITDHNLREKPSPTSCLSSLHLTLSPTLRLTNIWHLSRPMHDPTPFRTAGKRLGNSRHILLRAGRAMRAHRDKACLLKLFVPTSAQILYLYRTWDGYDEITLNSPIPLLLRRKAWWPAHLQYAASDPAWPTPPSSTLLSYQSPL